MRNSLIVLYCTVVAVAILYEHQALLPLLARHWGVGLSDAALLTTVTMTPLAIAPLLYGYVLERVSARRLLVLGLGVLTAVQFVLAQAPGYGVFLLLRGLEGLILPAVLTALMTYSAAIGGPAGARRAITLYIAATIVGGFSGRTFSGVVADWIDWQAAFWMWSALALAALVSTRWLASDPRADLGRVRWSDLRELVARPVNRLGLGSAFLLFFAFAAMMNFLPFRMHQLDPGITQGAVAWVYAGYLVGVVVPLSSLWLIRRLGGERRTLLAGCAVYFVGTLALAFGGLGWIYAGMFVFAAGMFTLHSVLSAYLNHLEPRRKGLVNGLYVSSYYSGGAVGSYLPGLVYQHAGWVPYSLLLLLLLAALGALLWRMPDAAQA
ncbi:hypothetical protein BJI67_14635 [Acidihalobacter aeolianus]|uniref:Major facilitator superfamily (MFS) profile domain-containing protein n=1 Tax=Acidihalobacter aeolianus TaxID=2792603 RepID=A0A1D8KCI3_9GAMM|nr:hypothetical protein BJI67_14635 [Acidihalobacter aeolianus]